MFTWTGEERTTLLYEFIKNNIKAKGSYNHLNWNQLEGEFPLYARLYMQQVSMKLDSVDTLSLRTYRKLPRTCL